MGGVMIQGQAEVGLYSHRDNRVFATVTVNFQMDRGDKESKWGHPDTWNPSSPGELWIGDVYFRGKKLSGLKEKAIDREFYLEQIREEISKEI